MAGHTGLFATSTECIAKAGSFYDSTGVDEAMINEFCLQVESYINCISRYDWSALFSAPATTTLNATVWHLLGEAESNLVGIYMIEHNMQGLAATGYENIVEAEDMINVLSARANTIINLLRDQKVVDFINGA